MNHAPTIMTPPSTAMSWPVMKCAPVDARNAIAGPMSSVGSPRRPPITIERDWPLSIFAATSGPRNSRKRSAPGVSAAGARVLTVMPCRPHAARRRTRPRVHRGFRHRVGGRDRVAGHALDRADVDDRAATTSEVPEGGLVGEHGGLEVGREEDRRGRPRRDPRAPTASRAPRSGRARRVRRAPAPHRRTARRRQPCHADRAATTAPRRRGTRVVESCGTPRRPQRPRARAPRLHPRRFRSRRRSPGPCGRRAVRPSQRVCARTERAPSAHRRTISSAGNRPSSSDSTSTPRGPS